MNENSVASKSDEKGVSAAATRSIVDVPALFDAIEASLTSAFEPVRKIPHYGESGRAVEGILRNVLANHFPSRFGLRSGIVVGADSCASRQCDLLIVDEMNCPAFLRSGDTGIFPAGSILGCIEVTTNLDKAKFDQDAEKIRVLKNLYRGNERLHWNDAPCSAVVAVDGPSNIETSARWLQEALVNAQDASREWEVPGCILILGSAHASAAGIVCYWDAESGVDRLSFNPLSAGGVCYFETAQDALLIFLVCFMSELRRVGQERWKNVAANFILGPVEKPQELAIEVGDENADLTPLCRKILEAVGLAFGHFPEMGLHLGDELFKRLEARVKKVE